MARSFDRLRTIRPVRASAHGIALAVAVTSVLALNQTALAADPTPNGCQIPPTTKGAAAQAGLTNALVTATNILILRVGGTSQVTLNDKSAAYAILNTSVASVSSGSGNAQVLTIKGEHQGDTVLRVTTPGVAATDKAAAVAAQCADVGIIVKPPSNPFVLSVGLGTSSVAKRTINVVPSSPAIDPVGVPAAGSTTVNRAVLTEDSKSQGISLSALGHVRFTDNTYNNWYGTLGALGSDGGILYGISYGAGDALFITIAAHSSNVTDFASGYRNNAIVPAGVSQVTLTRRQTGIIFAISVPISILGGSGFLGAK